MKKESKKENKNNIFFKDVKEFNKYLLLTIGVSIIALSGTISYFINGSYAAWNSVSYSDDVFNLSVSVPTGIEISTPPTKTEYKEGETFDLTGMVVQQVYSSGRKVIIEDFDISPKTELTTNDTTITISYNGFTATQNITVKTAGMDALTFAQSKVGTGGLQQVTHPADSTLQIGTTSAITEYRYRGKNGCINISMTPARCFELGGTNYDSTANLCTDATGQIFTINMLEKASCEAYGGEYNANRVNNYVTFNNETWRIIGVIPTDDGTGNIENRIKIIKPTSLGDMNWDSGKTNNWARPTSLNTYLNSTYYSTLSTEAKSMIGPTKYYLGGYNTAPDIKVEVMWQYERKTSGGTYYYSGNPNSYTGNIAIMYASDYGYAASSTCSNSTTIYNYYDNSCPDNNWLYLSSDEWLLSQNANYSNVALSVLPPGTVHYILSLSDVSYYQYGVRPVLTLSSNVVITGGSGTPDDTYKLGM